MKTTSATCLLLFLALCSGCGQKGDLYLPTPQAQPANVPDQAPTDNGADNQNDNDEDDGGG